MEIDLGGYGKKTKRLVKGAVKEVTGTVREGRELIETRVAGGRHLVEKRAMQGYKIVNRTELGGTLIGGATFIGGTGTKIVGKGGRLIGGTLTEGATLLGGTLTEGATLLGGTLADGTKILGNTVLMGTDLVSGGIQHLIIGEKAALNDSVFFEKANDDPKDAETFDNDFDDVLPTRFQKSNNKKKAKPLRPSLKVEWDDEDWDTMGTKPAYTPKISVEKTVSEKALEVVEERKEALAAAAAAEAAAAAAAAGNEVSSDDDRSKSDDEDDIYLTEEEIRAKIEEEKRMMARRRKKRNRTKNRSTNMVDETSNESDDEFGYQLGRNLLSARHENGHQQGEAPHDGSTSSSAGAASKPVVMSKRMSNTSSSISSQTTSKLPVHVGEGGENQTIVISTQGGGGGGDITTTTTTNDDDDDVQMMKIRRGKQLWSKLRNHVMAKAAAKAMTSSMKKNTEFFSLFDEVIIVDNDEDPVEAAAKALREERDLEKRRVKTLLQQLDDYEKNLAQERIAVKEQRARVSKEKKRLTTALHEELEKNQALERQLKEIEAELDNDALAQREAAIQRQIAELRAENDVIQSTISKQDATLRQLHREKAIREKKKKQRHHQAYYSHQGGLSRSGHTNNDARSIGTASTGSATLLLLDDDDDDDDMTAVVTYLTRSRTSTTSAKMMRADLVAMNGELESRHQIIDMQVTELEQLREELRTYEEQHGILPLKEKLQSLQEEKKELEEKSTVENAELQRELEEKEGIASRYAEQISKLKLEETKKEMKRKSKEAAAEQAAETGGGGGLFGWFGGGGVTPVEETNDAEIALSKLGL
eukprot:scaffold3416_cov120-Cylindrotheca_fusiformis.AAC.3